MQPQAKGPLGAHTSTQGGLSRALEQGAHIGATTIQLFTANQRRWYTKPLSPTTIQQFIEIKEQRGLTHIMSHASYLINLGSPNPDHLAQSQHALEQEIARCQALHISYLTIHPGAHLTSPRSDCLNRIVDSLLGCQHLLNKPGATLRILLETTAGQGSNVGNTFEDMAYLLNHTATQIPIGICLDTCHVFVAGHDLRTPQACETTLHTFDGIVGLEHLYALHLNDALHELGTRKDRHAPLGAGTIGWDCFRYLMQSKYTCHLPKYLETPGGLPLWKQEIAVLNSFCTPPT